MIFLGRDSCLVFLQLSEIIVIFAIVSTHNLRKYANRVICIWNTLFLLSE